MLLIIRKKNGIIKKFKIKNKSIIICRKDGKIHISSSEKNVISAKLKNQKLTSENIKSNSI